jgi:hypothetical protein
MKTYTLNGITKKYIEEAKEKIKIYGTIVEIGRDHILFTSELKWGALRNIFRGLGIVCVRGEVEEEKEEGCIYE